jgi:hypothetical protein
MPAPVGEHARDKVLPPRFTPVKLFEPGHGCAAAFGLAALVILIWPATALAATDPDMMDRRMFFTPSAC